MGQYLLLKSGQIECSNAKYKLEKIQNGNLDHGNIRGGDLLHINYYIFQGPINKNVRLLVIL